MDNSQIIDEYLNLTIIPLARIEKENTSAIPIAKNSLNPIENLEKIFDIYNRWIKVFNPIASLNDAVTLAGLCPIDNLEQVFEIIGNYPSIKNVFSNLNMEGKVKSITEYQKRLDSFKAIEAYLAEVGIISKDIPLLYSTKFIMNLCDIKYQETTNSKKDKPDQEYTGNALIIIRDILGKAKADPRETENALLYRLSQSRQEELYSCVRAIGQLLADGKNAEEFLGDYVEAPNKKFVKGNRTMELVGNQDIFYEIQKYVNPDSTP